MNLYINDISYQPQVVNANPHHLINDFVDVWDRAKNFLFEKVIMPDDYKTREITQQFSFITYQGTAHYKDVTLVKFKSILANQIKKVNADEIDSNIQYVSFNNQESNFLKKAYNKKVPVISFRTIADFDVPILSVVNKFLDEAEKEVITNEQIINLSRSTHFTAHQIYLNTQIQKAATLNSKWNAKLNPLRFLDAVNTYLIDIEFNKLWANSDTNYRVKLANEAGTYIAEMNGWQYEPSLTKKNTRTIFKALNQTIYLSIDTLHSTFELHDRKGKHLGEYNFSGTQLEGTQHNHNIEI
jgi:hypothetical protein